MTIVAELFPVLGSLNADVTLTRLDTDGGAERVACTVIVTVTVEPAVMVPNFAVTVPLVSVGVDPCVVVADTKPSAAGIISVSTAFVASSGPLFVTVSV